MEGTNGVPKKFVIESRKTFIVHGEAGKARPTRTSTAFERYLVNLPGTDRQVLFARQNNDSDCGPCFVLNACSVLDVPTTVNSVRDVREQNNTLRARQAIQMLDDARWFLTSDVAQTLESQGLRVEPYSIKSPVQENDFQTSLQLKIDEENAFVVYSGTGRHFKGIYTPDGHEYYLLDSQHLRIEPASRRSIDELVSHAKMSDRAETIAMTYR